MMMFFFNVVDCPIYSLWLSTLKFIYAGYDHSKIVYSFFYSFFGGTPPSSLKVGGLLLDFLGLDWDLTGCFGDKRLQNWIIRTRV